MRTARVKQEREIDTKIIATEERDIEEKNVGRKRKDPLSVKIFNYNAV